MLCMKRLQSDRSVQFDSFAFLASYNTKALINKLLSVNWYFLSTSCVVVDSLLFVTPIVGFCNCSLFCCVLLCLHSSFAIISMGKREQFALLCLSSCVALPRGAMGLSAVCDWCIF